MSEPEWLSSGESSSQAEPVAEKAKPSSSSGSNEVVPYKDLVQGAFSFALLGTGLLMAFTGVSAIMKVDSSGDAGELFIGLYMILFAIILFMYEVICIKSIEVLENFYAKNFGFLYGPLGKSAYLFL